ncbi:hypothetical protein [Candidatus Pelagibacter bacterium nBUS_36]|jgi:hypothetical protein|uniref:hypothetical protein n=1 Tax=Candidatus Pelagibacter bacterium nBUS_36 TaxID=3374194 RepID=UPI003EBB884B
MKIKKLRENILGFVKKNFLTLYEVIIIIGGYIKFFNKINRKKKYIKFSSNLDKINHYEYQITSQNNEDGIINHIFDQLKIDKLNFIEIGFDYYQNNSLAILKRCNKGLFLDGDNKKSIILRNVLKLFYPKTKITVQNVLVDIDNINQIKEQNFSDQEEIDFLSIDVDGIDYYLFKEINFKPKLICIEYNFWFGKDLSCAVPYEKNYTLDSLSNYVGTSLKALTDLANSKGYHLIAIDSACINAFFIRGDLKHHFEILSLEKSFKYPLKFNEEFITEVKEKLLLKDLKYFK